MFLSVKDIYKSLNFLVISICKDGRESARGFPAFYYIHFFFRRNPSLPYGCTATKRIFDDSAHFHLSTRAAEKVQTEKVKGKCTFLVKDIYES